MSPYCTISAHGTMYVNGILSPLCAMSPLCTMSACDTMSAYGIMSPHCKIFAVSEPDYGTFG
jgi:hypothetical protein